MPEALFFPWWTGPLAFTVVVLAVSVGASVHVVLYKPENRSAVGWIGLIWLSPFVGAVLYAIFGVNRVRRKALALRETGALPWETPPVEEPHDGDLKGLEPLARLVGEVVGAPLLAGNRVTLLDSGDEAYPAMLDAIEQAEQSVTLLTYIFDRDGSGRRFADALGRAVERGVEVRVLVDAVGVHYSLPSIAPVLRRRGVPVALFLPPRPWSVTLLNLRNHRKILVVDGKIGFTGGMNIRDAHVLADASPLPTRDLMCRLDGPAVRQLQEAFATDWLWTTKEHLEGPRWFPRLEPMGDVHVRVVPDGPDEDFDKARYALVGALACARERVAVLTPYFLPDTVLRASLNAARMRGVEVDILLPETNNLPYVAWASRADQPDLIAHGCRIWMVSGPFDHSKLMVVDGQWILLGSANWDPRSLRLNFELNLECYDRRLAAQAEESVRERLQQARQVTLEELEARSLPVLLRDGVARLFKPYI